MAHFAQLNEDNIVVKVIVVSNTELLDNEVESESKGIAFCESLFGGRWIQTSYNGAIRGRFASIGYRYDSIADIFIAPQPFPSWVLSDNYEWQPPMPMPDDGKSYQWNEEMQIWQQIGVRE